MEFENGVGLENGVGKWSSTENGVGNGVGLETGLKEIENGVKKTENGVKEIENGVKKKNGVGKECWTGKGRPLL
jgi:hypothetical protein